jgi:hypothetical protein
MSNPPTPSFGPQKGIKKVGGPPSGTPQPDWEVTDDGKGLLTGTLRFFYNVETGKPNLLPAPARGTKHPFDERLICKDSSSSIGSNNIGYVNASYIGLSQDPTIPEWELSCPTEETSIQMHPAFNIPEGTAGSMGVIKTAGVAPTFVPTYNDNMVVKGGPTNSDFEKFKVSPDTISKDLVGVETYKVMRPTITITIQTANQALMLDAIRNTGKQYSQPPFGPPWLATEGRTWLFTSLSVSEYSGIFKLSTEYMLSGLSADGKGKTWNKLIYPVAGSK